MKTKSKQIEETTGKILLSPSAKRKDAEKTLIVSLYLKGNTLEQTARAAGDQFGKKFSLNAVSKWVREAIENWKIEKADLLANHKAIEIAKINNLELVYWNEWELSKQMIVKTSETKKKGEEKMALAMVKKDMQKGMGDEKYLKGVQWCIDMRFKILGYEVPQVAIQVNNNNNNTNTTIVQRVINYGVRKTTVADQTISIDAAAN